MNRFAQTSGRDTRQASNMQSPPRLSALGFFARYPIFLLAFGPPVFRLTGVDVTEGKLDPWSFLQIGLLFAVAVSAITRLATARSILIPREIRSILKYAFILGALFLISTIYSPSRFSTAAYSILYLITWVCIVEFIANVYRNPINWMQCLFQLRLISLLLLILSVICLFISPLLVMKVVPEEGIQFLGGGVAPVSVVSAVMVIVSGYAFLYSLEGKMRSAFYMFLGLTGVVATLSRGGEISSLLSLAVLGIVWARTTKRSAYAAIGAMLSATLLAGVAVAAIGGERIWSAFNRGEDISRIESASGRTEVWRFVLHYCMNHPQGMGYIAGFRVIFKQYFSLSSGKTLDQLGTAHNTLFDILAGAGWLALAVYLILLAKLVWMALRVIKEQSHVDVLQGNACRHAIQCSLLLLFYCFVYGMGATEFLAPLRAGFNYQYIIMAIILGATAKLIAESRRQRMSLSKGCRPHQEEDHRGYL